MRSPATLVGIRFSPRPRSGKKLDLQLEPSVCRLPRPDGPRARKVCWGHSPDAISEAWLGQPRSGT